MLWYHTSLLTEVEMTLSPSHWDFQYQKSYYRVLALWKIFWNSIFFSPLVASHCSGTMPCRAHTPSFPWTFLFLCHKRRKRKPKSGEYVDCGIFVIYLIHSERAVCNDGLSWWINHTPSFQLFGCFIQYYKTSKHLRSFICRSIFD